MKHRLDSIMRALQDEMTLKVEAFKHGLEDQILKEWRVKPLAGKGVKTEQAILDILQDEPIKVVDQILTHLPRLIDSFVYEEMGKRVPASLKVTFPE